MKRRLLLLAVLLWPLCGSGDTIYRNVDKNGRVSFSDTATGSAGERALQTAALRPLEQLPEAVFRPLFQTAQGDVAAGKIFVATVPGCSAPLLLTALHLFGPAGGLPAQVGAQDIRNVVSAVRLSTLGADDTVADTALDSLTPNDARAFGESGPTLAGAGDVAAFFAPKRLAPRALAVADASAQKGDKVFVLTSVAGSRRKYVHEARVTGREGGYLAYEFASPDYDLQATSGAPVVNARGQVVAVNVAGTLMPGGQRFRGLGTPAEKWRDGVAQNCARKAFYR